MKEICTGWNAMILSKNCGAYLSSVYVLHTVGYVCIIKSHMCIYVCHMCTVGSRYKKCVCVRVWLQREGGSRLLVEVTSDS